MTGPEYLSDEAPRRGRRSPWAVLGIVVLVLVGLTVFRVSRPDAGPLPDPTAPPSTPSPTTRTWPAGLPSGTLFSAAAGSVQTVDIGSGLLSRTYADIDPSGVSLTPIADGVLAWQSGRTDNHVVLVGGLATYPTRGALQSAGAFLPGPDGTVWAGQGKPGAETRWRKVDLDGRPSTTVRVRGSAVSDGAGGLLDSDVDGFTRAYPAPRTAWQPGDVLATGPDGYVVRSCLAERCSAALRHRTGDRNTYLTVPVNTYLSHGTLSTRSRFLTLTEFSTAVDALTVYDVGTGEALHTFSAPGHVAGSAVWLDERWLALVSQDQLMLYDAVEDHVVVPTLPLSSIGPLVWLPAEPAR